MTSGTEILAGSDSLPGLLVSAATEHPLDPWLFFRRDLDWRWRSYARVLEQVAAGAAQLRGGLGAEGGEEPVERPGQGTPVPRGEDSSRMWKARPSDLWWADGVAALLCALSAGADVELGDGESGGGPGAVWLPTCRGELEGPRPDPAALAESLLAVAGRRGGEGVELRTPAGIESVGSLLIAASTLGRRLPPGLGIGRGRAVVFASPACAPPATLGLLAWILASRAAWVLEPHRGAFVATTLWARPSVVAAPAADLRALAEAFGKAERRRSRLKALIQFPELGGAGIAAVSQGGERQRIEAVLGAPLLDWPV
ncbi:MAG: hypothetical protein MI919_21610 [Holophagales bacterium]|nr:hypothetical protein [Holophagales bacterium]